MVCKFLRKHSITPLHISGKHSTREGCLDLVCIGFDFVKVGDIRVCSRLALYLWVVSIVYVASQIVVLVVVRLVSAPVGIHLTSNEYIARARCVVEENKSIKDRVHLVVVASVETLHGVGFRYGSALPTFVGVTGKPHVVKHF